jgi:hypothetical protein
LKQDESDAKDVHGEVWSQRTEIGHGSHHFGGAVAPREAVERLEGGQGKDASRVEVDQLDPNLTIEVKTW